MELLQEFKYPNINQEQSSNTERENDEKSVKITQNVHNYNDSDSKSEINVEKGNSQSTPENHNTNENSDELHVDNDNSLINTQGNNKNITGVIDKFATIGMNDSHTKESIPKMEKGKSLRLH